MILKTKEFQEAANKILLAAELDKNAANLELIVKDSDLFLNVTNKAYYVSVKFALEEPTAFRAVVDASLFLNLIAGISTETFELTAAGNAITVQAGKSSYKLAMIFDGADLMVLPTISIGNKTVEMNISNDILMSILNVNSKEIQKAKKIDVNELQKLYYIDETGCFTFTTGACLNSFTLEKPIKLLLNEQVVKLFKLFKEDVKLSFGYDQEADNDLHPKAVFETPTVYVAAKLTYNDVLLHKIQGPCDAAKNWINTTYANHLVISSSVMSAAIARLMLFNKNSFEKINMSYIPATISITQDEITFKDSSQNIEVIQVENGSNVDSTYEMNLNIADLKAVLDSCKNDHITLNCGNHKSVIISRGNISNVIAEIKMQ